MDICDVSMAFFYLLVVFRLGKCVNITIPLKTSLLTNYNQSNQPECFIYPYDLHCFTQHIDDDGMVGRQRNFRLLDKPSVCHVQKDSRFDQILIGLLQPQAFCWCHLKLSPGGLSKSGEEKNS